MRAIALAGLSLCFGLLAVSSGILAASDWRSGSPGRVAALSIIFAVVGILAGWKASSSRAPRRASNGIGLLGVGLGALVSGIWVAAFLWFAFNLR